MSGTIATTPKYWDCKCQSQFTHKLSDGNYCIACHTFATKENRSRLQDAKYFYDPENDIWVTNRQEKEARKAA